MLVPVLIRLPPEFAAALRALSKRTRIRKADYEREAISDLLAKYGALPEQETAAEAAPVFRRKLLTGGER